MTTTPHPEASPPSALTVLRELVPPRPLTPSEARQVIERLATRLLLLADVPGPPVPIEGLIRSLPRVTIKRAAGLPTSGRTQWSGSQWVICVASDESAVRQRYSLAHELAHVILHPGAAVALADSPTASADVRLERACEYFAACLLMPRSWVKRAYYNEGIQDLASLARLFNVSWVAQRVRLEQLGFAPDTRSAT